MASDKVVEELLEGDPTELTKPIKSVEDKWRLVPAFLKVLAFLKHGPDWHGQPS
jgi:hypothetical protein